MNLTVQARAETYAVCRLSPNETVPPWAFQGSFFSITKTGEELSVVCEQTFVPSDVKSEGDWQMLQVIGPLDFSLVGILAVISAALSKNNISLFAVSTFDTDYILVKAKDFDSAKNALRKEQITVLD